MLLSVLFLHLPRSSLEGLIHLFLGDLALVAPIQLEAPIIHSLLVTRFPLEGNLTVGGKPPLGGQPQVGLYNPLYGQNTSGSLAQLWNLLAQRNPQSSGGKQPQVNSFVPPHSGQPYPGSLNPTWGPNVHSSVPFQGNISNQPNPMGYMPPNPPRQNLSGLSTYMQTAYGPTGIPMGLPPQSHQYPHVNRQFPFLATLDLPDLSRILNDPILHSPHWPVIPAKLPSDIPKFDGRPGEDPNNHVMTFHLWCSSNSLMDDSIRLRLFQRTLMGSACKVVHRITARLL
jgi:hypothetical protein